jgi:hypothetical protein
MLSWLSFSGERKNLRSYVAELGCEDRGVIHRFKASSDEKAWTEAEKAISKFDFKEMNIENPVVVGLYYGDEECTE